jgi:hypothetical protein
MSLKKDSIDKQARFWVLTAGRATLTGASETVGVVEQLAVDGDRRPVVGSRADARNRRAGTCLWWPLLDTVPAVWPEANRPVRRGGVKFILR